jgi:hypothetical protein
VEHAQPVLNIPSSLQGPFRSALSAAADVWLDELDFFEAILARMRQRMRQLGSRRVHLPDGTWYWDLKPDFRFGEIVEI